MLLEHLYATSYTTIAGDRTSNLLACRMHTAWQRRLFPMFTVLTWSRDFAEMSLAMRVAAHDCDRRVDPTVLCDLEVLFGPASLEAPDPDRTGNPRGSSTSNASETTVKHATDGRSASRTPTARTSVTGSDPTTGAPCGVSASSTPTTVPSSGTNSTLRCGPRKGIARSLRTSPDGGL